MSAPDWVPTASTGARTVPAGRWWDIVEVDASTAICVLSEMTGQCGPVFEDQGEQVARWLLQPGAAASWNLPEVNVLGHGNYITVPPAEWRRNPSEGGPPIRWLVPPLGRRLTDPTALHLALTRVASSPSLLAARRG